MGAGRGIGAVGVVVGKGARYWVEIVPTIVHVTSMLPV